MKDTLLSFLKFILFWMFVFFLQRFIFYVFHFEKISIAPSSEQSLLFIKGLRLDLSMTGYILLFPVILLPIRLLLKRNSDILNKVVNIYSAVILFIVVILSVVDLNIYTEWGTKINSRAIEFFLLSPGEAMASSSTSPVFLSFTLIVLQIVLFYYLYRRYFKFDYQYPSKFYFYLIAFPALAFINVMMVRGGLQLAPINQSSVYFSNHTPVNHAALNTEWNLMHSVIENHFSNKNPYVFMPDDEASYYVDSLYANNNNQNKEILKTSKPNIVFIILESYTSDVIEAFGGEKGVSPNITTLANEGLAFTNIYASGDRTDKGMIALLSGFPSQAVRTIIQQPDKFEKLPSLPKELKNIGYDPAFYYGGESEFSNFKSYLLSTGIKKIIDKKDFKQEEMNSKWGAHDGFLFDKSLTEISKQKEPFFSVILTLSSHEPFEIPVPTTYTGNDLPSLFRKSAHYTDQCLGDFIEKAKREKWYKNTLFIIVADHGHRLPKEYETNYAPGKFRIPLIFYGAVIKDEILRTKNNITGSQTDLASTLLYQLGQSDSSFRWSKNLMNPAALSFAFYSYDNGIGWVEGNDIITIDNVDQRVSSNSNKAMSPEDQAKKEKISKAYMQAVFKEYLQY